MRVSILRVGGIGLSFVIAITATWLLINSAGGLGPEDWQGWRFVEPLAVAGAWLSVVAWASDRRLLAILGHVASLFVPWGYLYPLPFFAVVLAIVAGATFKSSRVSPREVV